MRNRGVNYKEKEGPYSKNVVTSPLVGAAKTGVCWAGTMEPRTQPHESFTPREGSNSLEFSQDFGVQQRRGAGGRLLQKAES